MTDETTDRAMPTDVIQALARIMEDLPAIAKKKHPTTDGQGVSYPYRGIEEITAEAQGLFAKYCVVPIPWKTVPVETREFQVKSGATWTDEKIEIHWKIYGPGGVADLVEAQTLGIGRDNSDKGFNKAATQAFKYLLLDMLLIADPKDDADGTTVENDGGSKGTTTRRAPNRPKPQETNSQDPGSRALAEDDDVATMSARALSEALGAAGLEQGGTVPQMRLRLQEARSGVAPAKTEAPADPNAATEKQIGMIQKLFGDTERSVRLARCEEIIGISIESSTDLTKRQASAVIEVLLAEQKDEDA
jgi:hypothetical protein